MYTITSAYQSHPGLKRPRNEDYLAIHEPDAFKAIVDKATVTVKDAPYQQWQQEWWPSDVPATTIYSAYPTAAMGANPLFLFRLGESSGTSVSGVNGTGAGKGAGVGIAAGSSR